MSGQYCHYPVAKLDTESPFKCRQATLRSRGPSVLDTRSLFQSCHGKILTPGRNRRVGSGQFRTHMSGTQETVHGNTRFVEAIRQSSPYAVFEWSICRCLPRRQLDSGRGTSQQDKPSRTIPYISKPTKSKGWHSNLPRNLEP